MDARGNKTTTCEKLSDAKQWGLEEEGKRLIGKETGSRKPTLLTRSVRTHSVWKRGSCAWVMAKPIKIRARPASNLPIIATSTSRRRTGLFTKETWERVVSMHLSTTRLAREVIDLTRACCAERLAYRRHRRAELGRSGPTKIDTARCLLLPMSTNRKWDSRRRQVGTTACSGLTCLYAAKLHRQRTIAPFKFAARRNRRR